MASVYKILYLLGCLILIPWLWWSRYVRGKQHHILQRLFPQKIEVTDKYLVWVHSVSVGEVHAVAPIVRALQEEHPDWYFVLSTITHTGQETAKKILPNCQKHLFLPLDIPFSVRRSFGKNPPNLVLYSEGDIWPIFTREAKKLGATIAVVNGKVSEKSFARLSLFPRVVRFLMGPVDVWCAQSEVMAVRLRNLGIDSDVIHVTGNTKADLSARPLKDEETLELKKSLHILPGEKVVVCGSTHSSEEDLLVRTLLPILQPISGKLIIVPRHPERFDEVVNRMSYLSASVCRLSTYNGLDSWDIFVIDSLGRLSSLYQIADIAIVCGSFVESIGGHNILESAVFGVPTVVGPYMHSQRSLYDSASEMGGVISTTKESVGSTVSRLLTDACYRSESGMLAKGWAEKMSGATKRTVEILNKYKK